MIRQNILNYDFRNIDLTLSDSFVDLTLCNENLIINDQLTQNIPIDYLSNKLYIDLTNSSTTIETITLKSDEYILTVPFNDFKNHFGVLYVETFLPTDSYIFVNNGDNDMIIDNFNLPLDKGGFDDLTYTEIINKFGNNVNRNENLDTNRVPKFKPYPYKTLLSEETLINVRENYGWTMEFLFDFNNIVWGDEKTFFYLGTRGTNIEKDYVNNGLSFSFDNTKKLSVKYTTLTKICSNELFFEDINLKTKILPEINNKMLVTLVFIRDHALFDCDLLNKGGINDLISNNDPDKKHEITKKWLNGKKYRMGKIKVYINGKFFQTLSDFEEIILSERGEQPYIMNVGGGVDYLNNIHNTSGVINLTKYRYYNEPLGPLYIKHNFNFKY